MNYLMEVFHLDHRNVELPVGAIVLRAVWDGEGVAISATRARVWDGSGV